MPEQQTTPASFPRRFEGRSVLVTGAGTGFGAEIAVRAAQEGARVVVHYNRSREGAALTGLTMGQLGEMAGARDLIGGLAGEGCAVARALGITLDDDPLAMIEEAVTHAHGHRPSMLQDVLARRPTEIAVLNGAIVRRGTEAGVPVLLNQAVTTLVDGLEQSWE
jgi:NAD(P)-dependent dehydrogenase (short-subunit alcohol dehydrogenase family)